MQIAICKCYTKSSPGGTGKRGGEREGEEEEEEEEVYEEMGGDEGGVAVIIGSNKANDPTHMEIGDRGDTIELRRNKAYDTFIEK